MKPGPLLILLAFCFPAFPSAIQSQSTATDTLDSTRQQLTTLRDAFVRSAKDDGLVCPFDPPKIVLSDIASFGNYDEKKNTLTTPLWSQLSSEERSLFFHLAGPGAEEAAARRIFENGTHHWVFIHEMGHWAQACRNRIKGRTPYATEYEANRIAAAYWRETDPELLAGLQRGFESMLQGRPSPVPQGQSVEAFFNEHYEQLGMTPDYTWFQARMVTTACAETPVPTFKDALEQIGRR